MMEFFFLFFYISIFALLVRQVNFFKLKKIDKTGLLLLLSLKIIAGFTYVYVSKNLISAGDVFSYYKDGLIVYQSLMDGNYLSYLQLTFGLNNVGISENITQSVHEMGFWYDTSAYMMVRSNAFINLFTFGSGVYVNSIFFSFISFIACVLLAKMFENYLQAKSYLVYYIIFLAPSLLFWTSGMHKESLSVFLIVLILFTFFKLVNEKLFRYLPLFMLSLGLLYLTRFFVAAMLLPPIFAYFIWSYNKSFRPLIVFGSFFAFVLATSYLLPVFFGLPNLVDEVLSKKELYEALDNGNTAIELGHYEASYFGLLMKVPQALFNSLVRPHFMDVHSLYLALASLESLFVSCAFVVSLFYMKQLQQKDRAIIFVFFSFALSYLILTGLIVPNLGAILRYRSVALFLLYPGIAFLLEKRNVI